MKVLFSILFTYFFISAVAQQQLGASVCGSNQSTYLGQSIKMSVDGQRMVVSSQGYGDLISVRVFELNNGEWTDLGATFQNANVQNSYVLVPVSCNATCSRIVYSDVYNDETGTDRGKVVVRELQGGNWVVVGNGIFGEHNNELSGSALDMSASGNRIIVGSNLNDASANNSGKVKVYELQNGVWTQLGGDLTGGAAGDRFGAAVVISADGQRIACGAPYNSNLAPSAGAIRIYELVGGQWQLISQINGTMQDERFGGALSFNESATILAVGCDKLYGFGGGKNMGVEIFQEQSGAWNQLGNTIPAESNTEYFGAAVTLSQSGNAVAIGAPQHNIAAGDSSGYTKVYQFYSGMWSQIGTTIYGVMGGDSDNVGYALSFSHTGRLAVSAPYVVGSGRNGCVTVYDVSNVLATAESEQASIEVWPNPVESILYINNIPSGTKFFIKDLMGKVLLESDRPSLDLESFSSGIYLLEISNGKQKLIKKIIKK